jgi:hypothetical protein
MRIDNIFLDAVGALQFQRFRFTLESVDRAVLPPFLGSTLRGSMAMAFKRMHCIYQLRPCDGCRVQRQCLYPALFETPTPPENQAIKRLRDIPHPLLIEPPLQHPRRYQAGDRFTFDVVLLGSAVNKLAYFVFAVNEMAKEGLGVQRYPFHLLDVFDDQGHPVFDAETQQIQSSGSIQTIAEFLERHPYQSQARLRFATPMRIKVDKKIQTKDMTLDVLIPQILRRLSALVTFYGPGFDHENDFYALLHQTPWPTLAQRSLRWKSVQRYSNRQKKKLNIGGLIGTMDLVDISAAWWPILVAATVLHAGKATVMGLGQIALTSANGRA